MREADRRRMETVARDLASVEIDDQPAADAVERIVAAADRGRARRGIPPLRRDDAHPEEELYRRVRALGLRRHRG